MSDRWRWLLPVVTLVGCADRPPLTAARRPPATTRPAMAVVFPTMTLIGVRRQAQARVPPGTPLPSMLVHLDVYTFTMPAGTVDADDELWSHLRSDGLGEAVDAQLRSNGLRCGLSPKSQWPGFARYFAAHPDRARVTRVDATGTETFELPVGRPADSETVFFYDRAGRLQGRSFDRCTNGFSVTFGPSPGTTDAVRVTVCPTVHGERDRLLFTPLNGDYLKPFQADDRIYDLGLSLVVPKDQFLLIAPGENASADDSVGGRFLVQDGASEREETVIVIMPTLLPVQETPADPSSTASR